MLVEHYLFFFLLIVTGTLQKVAVIAHLKLVDTMSESLYQLDLSSFRGRDASGTEGLHTHQLVSLTMVVGEGP